MSRRRALTAWPGGRHGSAPRRAQERRAVLVVTHDPGQFLEFADRILVLKAGEAVFDGSVTALLDDGARAFDRAGLILPDVVRAQVLARLRGARLERFVFDASEAAELFASALGGTS